MQDFAFVATTRAVLLVESLVGYSTVVPYVASPL